MAVLEAFYTAFARRDAATMGALYHPQARFSDPVFPDLDAAPVRAMWRMLLTSGTDLRVAFTIISEDERSGLVRWEAWYTFSRTQRPVHNVITSTFMLKDGLILVQRDKFDFWRWSRQALGPTGLALGWTGLLRDRVRRQAAAALRRHMLTDRPAA
ncbi:MAG: nuclear transport factor 2 family protein [Flavobacteriales bacterium]|nr:hypothetical protein [Flavobacteriales bacterium]MCC6577543.1 nuclear transport factor 2 family protein [Flavobacteriales bacterium]NUQ16306.1 nuclear transport factor 2 family protein [Flavobacteriales bacterium]